VDPRLLDHYEEELAYLREAAKEFAAEHPDVAPRLGLDAPEIKDPYVERLLEGVAFMSARVQLKIDDEFPRFVQQMLDIVAPHMLAPTPSMCVVTMEPKTDDTVLEKGVTIPAGAALRGYMPGGDGPDCEFRTSRPVSLWPIKITEAEYILSKPVLARFAQAAGVRDYDSGIRLRLECGGKAEFAKLPIDHLEIYLSDESGGTGDIAKRLFEMMAGRCSGGAAQDPNAPPAKSPEKLSKPSPCAFEEAEALLPGRSRSFPGYRLLHEYFACPERFQFVRLGGLKTAFQEAKGNKLDLVYLFTRDEGRLIDTVGPDNFRLYATPAINCFQKHTDPVTVNDELPEHRLVVDRTRPYAFEVIDAREAWVWRDDQNERTRAFPMYDVGNGLSDWGQAAYFATRRLPLRPSPNFRKKWGLSDYVGTDTMVSLVRPHSESPREVAARQAGRGPAPWKYASFNALVSNRDYPLKLKFGTGAYDLDLEGSAPLESLRVVRRPTRPRSPMSFLGDPPDADRRTRGEWTWRAFNHLTPNFFSLVDPDSGRPNGLREHLAIYAFLDEQVARTAVDAVVSVNSSPVVRRVSVNGRQIVVRGQRIEVELDVTRFGGAGAYLFASVLARFLAEFASVNAFVETAVKSTSGAMVGVWPALAGQRASL